MKWFTIVLVLLSFSVFAAIDTFEFSSDSERQMFRQLSEELRCPKCQNQNLAGSNSAIALDLRRELHRMVLSGQSTVQIKTFMVDRYGEFVLYKPSVNSSTYMLWYGPFALLFIGFFVVFMMSRKTSVSAEKPTDNEVVNKSAKHEETTSHRQKMHDLLGSKND